MKPRDIVHYVLVARVCTMDSATEFSWLGTCSQHMYLPYYFFGPDSIPRNLDLRKDGDAVYHIVNKDEKSDSGVPKVGTGRCKSPYCC